MTITIRSQLLRYSDDLSGVALTAKVIAGNDPTILNGLGDAVTVGTLDVSTFDVAEALPQGSYLKVLYYSDTNELHYAGWVLISADSGTFDTLEPSEYASSIAASANNLESPQRGLDDVRPIEFDWTNIGTTFALGSSQRIFPGQASYSTLSGAITLVRSGRYSIAYNIADRAADATTIIPVEVTYKLIDDDGNYGFLTVNIGAVGGGTVSITTSTTIVEAD